MGQHGPGQPGWPCFSRGIGPDELQWSLPNSAVLWFCNDCLWIFCSVSSILSLQTDLTRFHFLAQITMEMPQRESLILFSHYWESKETSIPTIFIKSYWSHYSSRWCWPTSQKKCFSLPKAKKPTGKLLLSPSAVGLPPVNARCSAWFPKKVKLVPSACYPLLMQQTAFKAILNFTKVKWRSLDVKNNVWMPAAGQPDQTARAEMGAQHLPSLWPTRWSISSIYWLVHSCPQTAPAPGSFHPWIWAYWELHSGPGRTNAIEGINIE